MARRRRDSEKSAEARVDDVEAAVRAAARAIADRFETPYPAPDDLVEDADFRRTSKLLADPRVPFETVARLGRSTTHVTAAIAHRAVALRTDVPPEWSEWAYRRTKQRFGRSGWNGPTAGSNRPTPASSSCCCPRSSDPASLRSLSASSHGPT